MTRTELNKLQTILIAKRAELTSAGAKREGIEIERVADALDEVRLAAERELSTRWLERESSLLQNVHAAMDRIADGRYGVCLECEGEISQKRLQALPWATLCIACQQDADHGTLAKAA